MEVEMMKDTNLTTENPLLFSCPICNRKEELRSQKELDTAEQVYIICGQCWTEIGFTIKRYRTESVEKKVRGFLMTFLELVALNLGDRIKVDKILAIKEFINEKFNINPINPVEDKRSWLTATEEWRFMENIIKLRG